MYSFYYFVISFIYGLYMGYSHGLCNCKIGFLAFCLQSRILVYTVVNIILIMSVVCIALGCFHLLPCAVYFSVPSVCLQGFLKEFNVPVIV